MTRISLVLRGSLLAAVLLFPAGARADALTVPTTADPPSAALTACPSSPVARCTLRAGRSEGNTVLVPPGTYALSNRLARSAGKRPPARDTRLAVRIEAA